MNYAVIYTYSFDDDVAVYLFETEEEAVAFLKSSYEEELRIDIEENGWVSSGEISDDGWYARIETSSLRCQDVDVTEFRIGNVYR